SISNLLTVRFSFLTYLLTFDQKIKGHVVLLVCMECCQGSSCLIAEQPCCFPKASAKVELFSELTNKTQVFFENNRK
ncbi:MAG: hypothetical protein IKL56_07030, partial [Bacteroidaceae bacterium]|nr:hypothetical protein [Bacteroidaceae bacterium]